MATITKRSTKLAARGLAALAKAPTGIKHLDEVTGGGLPPEGVLPRGEGFLADVRRLLAARLVVARHCWLWQDTAGDGVSGSRHHQVRLKQGRLQFRCVRPTLLGLEALLQQCRSWSAILIPPVREFVITDRGVELADVYVGPLGGSQGKPVARP